MFKDTLEKVRSEVSSGQAYDHVVAISRFHRIQASPGFRKAADYCVESMLESSGEARVIHYPAESGVSFWSWPSFEEWSGTDGVLKIISPDKLAGKIADFRDCPISLIQRSKATPAKGLRTSIVYVGGGRQAQNYRGARGKLALCDAPSLRGVYDAAVDAGVAGLVLYRHVPLAPVRKGLGIEGARQYTSFWWDQRDLLGFVLTPEDGDRLASYLSSSSATGKPVRAWARAVSYTHLRAHET